MADSNLLDSASFGFDDGGSGGGFMGTVEDFFDVVGKAAGIAKDVIPLTSTHAPPGSPPNVVIQNSSPSAPGGGSGMLGKAAVIGIGVVVVIVLAVVAARLLKGR